MTDSPLSAAGTAAYDQYIAAASELLAGMVTRYREARAEGHSDTAIMPTLFAQLAAAPHDDLCMYLGCAVKILADNPAFATSEASR